MNCIYEDEKQPRNVNGMKRPISNRFVRTEQTVQLDGVNKRNTKDDIQVGSRKKKLAVEVWK